MLLIVLEYHRYASGAVPVAVTDKVANPAFRPTVGEARAGCAVIAGSAMVMFCVLGALVPQALLAITEIAKLPDVVSVMLRVVPLLPSSVIPAGVVQLYDVALLTAAIEAVNVSPGQTEVGLNVIVPGVFGIDNIAVMLPCSNSTPQVLLTV